MTKEADRYQKHQVQRSMFRTVARNLIQQLQDGGCSRDELVGFANEILQTIIDRGFQADTAREDSQPNGLVHRVEGLAKLSVDGITTLTEEISLKPIASSDLPALRQWLGDEAVSQSMAEQTLAEIIEAVSDADQRPDQSVFVLHGDGDEKPVGLVGLIHIEKQASQGELVKMIGDPNQRGKGLAKRATQMLVDFAFDELTLNRIYLRTLGGNMKNIRLNESLGFRFEGVLRQSACIGGVLSDVIVMGMVARDREEYQT